MTSIKETMLLISILNFQQYTGVLDLGQDTAGLISRNETLQADGLQNFRRSRCFEAQQRQ